MGMVDNIKEFWGLIKAKDKKNPFVIKKSFEQDSPSVASHSLAYMWIKKLAYFIMGTFLITEFIGFSTKMVYYKNYQLDNQKTLMKKEVKSIQEQLNKDKINLNSKIIRILRKRAEMGYNMAEKIYNQSLGILDKTQIEDLVIESLRGANLRNQYFKVITSDGVNLLYPRKTKIQKEGTSFLNVQDIRGNYYIKNMLKDIKQKQKGIFYRYYNEKGATVEKAVYFKFYEPLGIVIMTELNTYDYIPKFKKSSNIQIVSNISPAIDKYFKNLQYSKNLIKLRKWQFQFLRKLKTPRNKTNEYIIEYDTYEAIDKEAKMEKYGWAYSYIFWDDSDVKQNILYAKWDKKHNIIIFANRAVSTAGDINIHIVSVFLAEMLFRILLMVLLIYFIAWTVSKVLFEKVSKDVAKLQKDLAAATKKAEATQKLFDGVIEYYPYPLLIIDPKSKEYKLNKAYIDGGNFNAQYVKQDAKASYLEEKKNMKDEKKD